MRSAPLREGMICVGAVRGPHGIKGEVTLFSYLDDASLLIQNTVLETESGQPLTIAVSRNTPKGVLLKFHEIADRNAAEALGKIFLYIARTELPQTDDNEVYYADLISKPVKYVDGEPLGKITNVFTNGAQDILVIQKAAGGEMLVPYVADTVVEVADIITLADSAREFDIS